MSSFGLSKWLAILLVCLLAISSTVRSEDEGGEEHGDDTDFDNDKEGGDEDHHRPEDPDVGGSKKHFDKDGHHDDEFDHEAVTGSKEEAEEYKDLSPEESQKRLKVLVKKMDTNSDGHVDKKELNEWILNSFKKLDAESAKSKVAENDENDDKKVSWKEFVHKTYGYTDEEVEKMRKDKTEENLNFLKVMDDEKKKFDFADTNKDGMLSEEEYIAFEHPQNYAHMTPYEVAKGLEDYDFDKSGDINLREYMGLHANESESKIEADTLKSEKEDFVKYDKNGDGKLDKQEMVAWVMPGFVNTAKQEVDHLFKETDKDKNGQLSPDEISEQHELWVGSQATDYGKHLDDLKKEEL